MECATLLGGATKKRYASLFLCFAHILTVADSSTNFEFTLLNSPLYGTSLYRFTYCVITEHSMYT